MANNHIDNSFTHSCIWQNVMPFVLMVTFQCIRLLNRCFFITRSGLACPNLYTDIEVAMHRFIGGASTSFCFQLAHLVLLNVVVKSYRRQVNRRAIMQTDGFNNRKTGSSATEATCRTTALQQTL